MVPLGLKLGSNRIPTQAMRIKDISMETKQCTHCDKTLLLTDFHKRPNRRNGFTSICKRCNGIRVKANAGRVKRLKKIIPSEKKCCKCGNILPSICFSKCNRYITGLSSECKTCRAIWAKQHRQTEAYRLSQRRFYQTEKGKQLIRTKSKRMRLKYPEKVVARSEVHKARLSKKIHKPDKCSLCHQHKPPRALDAHHKNGYDEQHWLDIQWLCRKCHYKENSKMAIA